MTQELAPLSVEGLEVGTEVKGKITYVAVYGAMVDIGYDREALLHISQITQPNFRNVDDVFKPGDELVAYILKVDAEQRIALTLEKPPALPWNHIKKGEVYPGVITRLENYGAFVDIGAERPGMVHVSELTDGYVQAPGDVVKVGDQVEVRVINVNRRKQQIDLSMRTPAEELEEALETTEAIATPMELAFRRAQKEQKDDRGKKKEVRRSPQDDIISRTLRNHS